jgi:hypothetical protein
MTNVGKINLEKTDQKIIMGRLEFCLKVINRLSSVPQDTLTDHLKSELESAKILVSEFSEVLK